MTATLDELETRQMKEIERSLTAKKKSGEPDVKRRAWASDALEKKLQRRRHEVGADGQANYAMAVAALDHVERERLMGETRVEPQGVVVGSDGKTREIDSKASNPATPLDLPDGGDRPATGKQTAEKIQPAESIDLDAMIGEEPIRTGRPADGGAAQVAATPPEGPESRANRIPTPLTTPESGFDATDDPIPVRTEPIQPPREDENPRNCPESRENTQMNEIDDDGSTAIFGPGGRLVAVLPPRALDDVVQVVDPDGGVVVLTPASSGLHALLLGDDALPLPHPPPPARPAVPSDGG